MVFRIKLRQLHVVGLSISLVLFCSVSAHAQTISGNVHTETGSNVVDVVVSLIGPGVSLNMLTGNDGNFSFSGLPDNETYQLCLGKDINSLNGVSTFDYVLLAKHIGAVTPLNSSYKIIAADARNDNDLPDVSDLILMRKLILGIITDLPAPSWKFISADVTFSDPQNPFPDIPLPAGCKTINLSGNATGQDFIGMKTADLNNSAVVTD